MVSQRKQKRLLPLKDLVSTHAVAVLQQMECGHPLACLVWNNKQLEHFKKKRRGPLPPKTVCGWCRDMKASRR